MDRIYQDAYEAANRNIQRYADEAYQRLRAAEEEKGRIKRAKTAAAQAEAAQAEETARDLSSERKNGGGAQVSERAAAAPSVITTLPDSSTSSVQGPVNPPDILSKWGARKDRPSKTGSSPPAERKDAPQQPMPSTKTVPQRPKIDTGKVTGPGAKRSAPSSAFTDDRRAGSSKLPKTERGSAASPQSTTSAQSDHIPRQPPSWYNKMNASKARGKDSNTGSLLDTLRERIKKCKESRGLSAQSMKLQFDDVRTKLHQVAFVEVNRQLLRDKRMLHNHDGLPQLFDKDFMNGTRWPWDISADAEEQYNKWCAGIFEMDLLRGLDPAKPADEKNGIPGHAARVKKGYNLRLVEVHEFGNGKLLNGQWWPLQLCAVRDGKSCLAITIESSLIFSGAHCNAQGGIAGSRGDGAHSVIMSGGGNYDDIDRGDEIWYCGTEGADHKATEYTKRMLESVNNHPVRVLRSAKLSQEKSQFRPELGIRYDGLYDVVDSEVMDREKQVMRFRYVLMQTPVMPSADCVFSLIRRPDQMPIRGGSGPEKRPTQQEIDAYEADKNLRGFQ